MERKNGQFALFKNDKKGNEARPDLTGQVSIDGKEYWISVWSKVSQKGEKYLSGAMKEKQAKQPVKELTQEEYDAWDSQKPKKIIVDDEIPF